MKRKEANVVGIFSRNRSVDFLVLWGIVIFGAVWSMGCQSGANLGHAQVDCLCSCKSEISGKSWKRNTIACADDFEEAKLACRIACDESEAWGLSLFKSPMLIVGPIEKCKPSGDPVFRELTDCPLSSTYSILVYETGDVVRGPVPPLIITAKSDPVVQVDGIRASSVESSPWGEVSFAGGVCPNHECGVNFEKILMEIEGPVELPDGNGTLRNFSLVNFGPFLGNVDANGQITLLDMEDVRFIVCGSVDGDFYSRRARLTDWGSVVYPELGYIDFWFVIKGSNVTITVDHIPVYFTDSPPIALMDAPEVAECGVPTTLDGRRTYDPDGDPVSSLEWYINLSLLGEVFLGSGETLDQVFETVGTYYLALAAIGSDERVSVAAEVMEVQDTTPPTIELNGESVCLWPPSHDYVVLDLKAAGLLGALDLCDKDPEVEVIEIVSSQPDNDVGDGNTTEDAVVLSSGQVCVRVERAGGDKTPRIYTVKLRATDDAGNTSEGEFELATVPHDQRGHMDCIHTRGPGDNGLRQVDTCASPDSEGFGCMISSASKSKGLIPVAFLLIILAVRRKRGFGPSS